jgi:nitroimidazol reductase NimA-like FMN-containing flavoprotein (pyridoxamine 5'-phosphate oxidase superfamily)
MTRQAVTREDNVLRRENWCSCSVGGGSMYGALREAEIDALLQRHRFGRLAFTLDDAQFILPMNYGYDGVRLYGQAPVGTHGGMPGGTKIAGMRQHPQVAFLVDEIADPAHWRSVLVQGRYREFSDRAERQAGFRHIVAQAGGGERSEASWAMDIDHLVVFAIEIAQRYGRFEQREAYELRPLPQGPLPPIGAR